MQLGAAPPRAAAPPRRPLRRCAATRCAAAADAPPLRALYPAAAARVTGTLAVGAPHVLHFEEYGNPAGVPALLVHGGPGAACWPNHARFFDPQHYRIVLCDQRGCGRSTPLGCLEANTTDDLVSDFEALRVHLGIARWTLLGGSWGVALSLAYACAHPSATRALVLRGVCLMRRSEIDWAFRAGGAAAPFAPGVAGGAAALFPGSWAAFTRALGVPSAGGADPVAAAFAALSSGDAGRRAAAAAAWMRWGGVIGAPPPSKGVQSWDGARWASADAADGSAGAVALALAASPPAAAAPPGEPPGEPSAPPATSALTSGTEAQALLESFYCLNDGFFGGDAASPLLLARLAPLLAARIPAVAVHGRADALCPVANAYALHDAWPALELRVVGGAGHSMYDPRITHELLTATDAFRVLPL